MQVCIIIFELLEIVAQISYVYVCIYQRKAKQRLSS